MSQFKKKIFKKVFEANSDDVASIDGKKTQVMTEEMFIPLMGEMWDKAKIKYKKRYLNKAFKFAEWTHKHFYFDKGFWSPLLQDTYPDDLSTEKLFEIWKKEQ
jgi:hypothetical protein